MKKAAIAIGALLITSCSPTPMRFYYARLPEPDARKLLERNASPIRDTDIIYYDRNEGELYTSVGKIDGVALKEASFARVSRDNAGFAAIIKCRIAKSCNSNQFEGCSWETPPSENNSRAMSWALFKKMWRLGYPVVSTIYAEDELSKKTVRVIYFTECGMIPNDIARLR